VAAQFNGNRDDFAKKFPAEERCTMALAWNDRAR
jgi:hypothetical protein